MRDSSFRCVYCGKYVSYKDIEDGKIGQDFTPDSEFTTERMSMFHNKCHMKVIDKINKTLAPLSKALAGINKYMPKDSESHKLEKIIKGEDKNE